MLEKLLKLKSREKLGLCLAGLVIVFLLMDRFAIQPVADTLDWFDRGIETEEQEIAYSLSVVRQGPLVSKEYDVSGERIDKVAGAAEAIDSMRASIDEVARESGLMIGSMQEREPAVSKFHESYSVEIGSFDSTLPDLLQFLHKIDTMPGLMRVARLALDSDAERNHVTGSILITKVAVQPGDAG